MEFSRSNSSRGVFIRLGASPLHFTCPLVRTGFSKVEFYVSNTLQGTEGPLYGARSR